jgi:hypothetical protein
VLLSIPAGLFNNVIAGVLFNILKGVILGILAEPWFQELTGLLISILIKV